MAARAERITVDTTARLLTTGDDGHKPGSAALIKPLGGGLVVGGPDVTATTGYPLDANEPLPADLEGDKLYGVIATGTVVVAVLRLGV